MNVEDERMLLAVLTWCGDNPDAAEERKIPEREFQSMLDRGFGLSDKQRAWVESIYERLFDVPKYENLVSSGKVPRGREVPTPLVLQNLPKRPPPRRSET